MPKPRDIKGRIADLLALSTSSEPEEAKAALLMARRLMAKHKLTPEDCQENKSKNVVRQVLPITCTAMTDPWASRLAAVIAKHYCCKSYLQRTHGKKRVSIGLVGLEDDFQVCRRAILYAYECVMSHCLNNIRRSPGEPAGVCRERRNAYGWGFAAGLQAAFEQQEAEHQEWGLVMSVPQAVHDALADTKPRRFGKVPDGYQKHLLSGYQDGKNFDPDRKLLARPESA